MKVVLTADIEKGDKWEIIEVADGYARNFLFPQDLAMPATKNNVKTIEDIKKQQAKKLEAAKKEIEVLQAKLNKLKPIVVRVKAGEKGKLFGSVTTAELVEKIKEAGVEIEKKRIQTKSLKEAGTYSINVKLPFSLVATIEVEVVADAKEHEEATVTDMRDVLHKRKPRRRRDDDWDTKKEVVKDVKEEKAADSEVAAEAKNEAVEDVTTTEEVAATE